MNHTETQSATDKRQSHFRVDGAHGLATDAGKEGTAAGADAPSVPSPATSTVGDAEDATEQLQVQAGQLAQRLKDRRRDIDHREAQTNARIAQLENELRISRLWLREQSQEFFQRETELRQRLTDHETRVAACNANELAVGATRRQFAEESQLREELLVRRERQVLESQQRLADEASRLQAQRHNLELERDELDRRQPEQLVHQQAVKDWHTNRQELEQQLDHRRAELDVEREDFAARSRRWVEERDQQQQQLLHEHQDLEQKQTTLERVRSDVLRLHREALEMRIIAEQLWAQFSGRLTPADLTLALTKLHEQLEDEFRFARQDLESQRAAVQELLGRLEEKQRALTDQRQELVDWYRRRQAELAQQALELSDRQEHLDGKRQQIRELQEQWQVDRRQLRLAHPSEPLEPRSEEWATSKAS